MKNITFLNDCPDLKTLFSSSGPDQFNSLLWKWSGFVMFYCLWLLFLKVCFPGPEISVGSLLCLPDLLKYSESCGCLYFHHLADLAVCKDFRCMPKSLHNHHHHLPTYRNPICTLKYLKEYFLIYLGNGLFIVGKCFLNGDWPPRSFSFNKSVLVKSKINSVSTKLPDTKRVLNRCKLSSNRFVLPSSSNT